MDYKRLIIKMVKKMDNGELLLNVYSFILGMLEAE